MLKEIERAADVIGCSLAQLARALNEERANFYHWRKIPERVVPVLDRLQRQAVLRRRNQLKALKPVTRFEMRPDLYYPNGRKRKS